MERLEPILKSWVIWLTLAASVAGFVVLVVTDDSGHASTSKPHAPPRHGPPRVPEWRGEIAFAIPTEGADPTLVEVAAEERREPSVVFRAPEGQTIRDLAWSPDGARLAVVVGTPVGAGHVLTMSATGDNISEVTHGRDVTSASVAWSPNGRRLVYDLGRSAHPERGQPLVVSRADGSDAHVITPPHGFAVAPAWSPDGRLIAYVKTSAPGEFAARTGSIQVMPAAGGASHAVSGVYDGQEPSWAPDSRTVYFASAWQNGQGFVSVAGSGRGAPFLAFDCTAVLRCDTIGSPTFGPGQGALGFLVTVDHPPRALVSVVRSGSLNGSLSILRLPLYTCCLTWVPPAPGQRSV
jgi:dipeptidyl aminopeptidase/acylaminoacyl peptidase